MTELPAPGSGSTRNGGSDHRKEASGLAPETDPGRWEALVARILAEARPLLEVRRRRHSLARTLSGWRRPVVTGAVGLAAAAAATLVLLPGNASPPVEASIAEVAVPWSVAAWMDGSHAPTVEELVLALEEYSP
ncbi:MAG: hypothetical protein OXQ94_01710 [Gemmatimonadota bacterium]|nr:hypothetical protein [Gemmatimonadota bacterium]MDE2870396.1 hypothetical protein [Gemmatimonadota bacterium]